LCRGRDGDIRFWDAPENVHQGGILARSTVPAGPLVQSQVAAARELSTRIADALDYVGVLAVEFFAGEAGPVFNEMAPRVHNSGHWTLDGASVSQFEQHIRAIAGWPLGKPVRHGAVTMTNLIGDDVLTYEKWLTVPGATVHLYGKGARRPGRKMGHVTEVTPPGRK
jgi:5-(carboxyamino)imidazole ribonucleotide synthase